MRLLVTGQAVDLGDSALAYFHQWLAVLAERFEAIEVVCLREGRHALPSNVHIHTLGKEMGPRSRFVYAWRFYRRLWQLRGRYDAVFVHMNPEYAVLAGPLWRAHGKRVVLWYTHRSVDLKLRLALLFANAVATAAPESLRIKSHKVHVVGHGIDTAAFATVRDGTLHEPLALLSVGRITPIKRLEVLIDAVAILAARRVPTKLTLIGEPVYPSDRAYEAALKARAREACVAERVHFAGSLPYSEMSTAYRAADFSINLAPTGGIDKAVLESMAAGAIPLVANRAFKPLFAGDAEALLFDGSAEDVAEKLCALTRLDAPLRGVLVARLAASVRKEADVRVVVERLVALISP